MTPARRKRPAVEQDHPKRDAGVSRSAGSGRGPSRGFSIDDAMGEGFETARRIARASEETVKDVVDRGVDTAYMVIEEYMLRGRKAAGRHHERKNGSGTMGDGPPHDHENDWMSAYGPMAPFMAPFMAPWVASMKLWTDSMAQMMPGGPAAGRAWMEQMMATGAPWWGAGAALAPRLSYEVSSAEPAEVSATLDSTAYFAKLSVHALVPCGDIKGEAIKDVGISSASGHVCVRVTVPAGQASGRYHGQIHDEHGTRRGEVTLELKTRAGAAATAKR